MTVFFIDPQSYHGLEVYDYSLLDNVDENTSILFVCSSLFKTEKVGKGDHIHIKRVFHYNSKNGILKLISYCCSLLQIRRLVKKHRPQVIHIQWIRVPYVDLFFYRFIKRRYKIKIVFTAHNVVPHESNSRENKLYGRFYSIVDSIIVHENRSVELLRKYFNVKPESISVIRHGVLDLPTDPVLVQKEYEDIVSKHNIPENAIVFASLGLQSYYKGVDVLIDLWNKHANEFEDLSCHLILAGSFNGLSTETINKNDNVHVENSYVSNERLKAYMKRTNVALLPYREISQSGLLLTAIASKTPFLVTDVGGISEPLFIADVGWMITHCDEELLYQKMLQLAKNTHEVLDKKFNNDQAWEKVQSAYSWGSIGAKTSKLYKDLLKLA